MEAALLQRLRASAPVIAAAGVFNGKAAIDIDERKSDDASSFPAAIQTVIAGTKNYNQDGPQGARTWRMRWECMGLNADDAFYLAEAIIKELETAAVVGGVRFGRSFLSLERTFPPQDVADLRIFRRIVDMEITATF